MGYKMNGFSGFKESPAKQRISDLPKNFNTTGSSASTTPGHSTTKTAKGKLPKNFNATGSKKVGKFVTKGIKPLLKGVLKRGTGALGMFLGATQTATADQPKFKKGDTHYRDPKKSIF
jgi:hypothetical protein